MHTCTPFNIVQDIIRKKCFVMCLAEGRKKTASVYFGLCNIMSHRETDRHPSWHAYCMGGNKNASRGMWKTVFQSNEKCKYSYTENNFKAASSNHCCLSTEKYFWNIKCKSRAKTAAQEQIQRLSPPVDEVVTENEKKKNPAKRYLKNVIQKSNTGKIKQIN